DRWIDHASNLNYDEYFEVRKPNVSERKIQKTILLFQFTYIGAPYIYYGDEVGMWGADDPDCRKPMVWADYQYEPETHHPFGLERPTDTVEIDEDLLQYYKSMINLRKEHDSLRRGKYKTVFIDDEKYIFAFERWTDDETIRAIFNMSENTQEIQIDELLPEKEKWELIWGDITQKSYKLKHKSGMIYKLDSVENIKDMELNRGK
ncbi:MAG TPA: hypothetical protein DHW42_03070, partial [Candidatus Marinimicrobia bacterium]|nr:hypothetical protein [Candidatus Neomarinimicrobiota bacterium]